MPLALALLGSAYAQDDRSSEATAQPAGAENLPIAGYDKDKFNGTFIQSSNGMFRLEIGMYTQFRYSTNFRSDTPADTGEEFTQGFSVNRTRVFFTGHFTKKLPYQFRMNISSAGAIELQIAIFSWKLSDAMTLTVGRQFTHLTKEDWMFAQDILGMEYSENDFTFALGTSNGASFHHNLGRVQYWVSVTNGAFGGKEDFPSQTVSDLMVTARGEFLLAGKDSSGFDDLVGRRGHPYALMLGVAGAYQGDYDDLATSRDGAQGIVDLNIDGNGFHVLASGVLTWRGFDADDDQIDFGTLVQGGYFVHPLVQVYGRYNFIDSFTNDGVTAWHSAAVGTSLYPFEWTNRMKFTLEVSQAFSAIDDTLVVPNGSLGWLPSGAPQTSARLQAQFGF